jgi:hypothetical protein
LSSKSPASYSLLPHSYILNQLRHFFVACSTAAPHHAHGAAARRRELDAAAFALRRPSSLLRLHKAAFPRRAPLAVSSVRFRRPNSSSSALFDY